MRLLDTLPVPDRASDWIRRAARQRPIRRGLRAITTPSTHSRWLFVVGCYDSGTTIFHDVLATHPELAALPGEGAFLTSELHTPEEFGSVRLMYPVHDKIVAADRDADEQQLRADWGVFLDNDVPVALEKSISNLARIEWLATTFPDSHFIAIQRDGRTVAEGIRRRAGAGAYRVDGGAGSYPIADTATQWLYANERLREAEALLADDRFTTVTYEDFCADPVATLGAVCDFAGLTPHVFDLPSISNQNAKSIARLSDDDLAEIERVAGADLRAMGYLS